MAAEAWNAAPVAFYFLFQAQEGEKIPQQRRIDWKNNANAYWDDKSNNHRLSSVTRTHKVLHTS